MRKTTIALGLAAAALLTTNRNIASRKSIQLANRYSTSYAAIWAAINANTTAITTNTTAITNITDGTTYVQNAHYATDAEEIQFGGSANGAFLSTLVSLPSQSDSLATSFSDANFTSLAIAVNDLVTHLINKGFMQG